MRIMRRTVLKLCLLLHIMLCAAFDAVSQSQPLYRLPETLPARNSADSGTPFLLGTEKGLYRLLSGGRAEALWTEGRVERILKTKTKWYFLTEKGVLVSSDLSTFTECNEGLPVLTIKTYDGEKRELVKQSPLLKDICADPFDENILVTATKDAVYLTRDGGASWKSIGSMSKGTAGMKAVACAHMPIYAKDGSYAGSELVVFMSHPIYGFSYYRADAARPQWNDVSAGFGAMRSLTQPDEISDILPVLVKDSDGTLYTEIYLANSFLPNMYRFDWRKKTAVKIYHGSEAADTIDGLCQSNGLIVFSSLGKISSVSLDDGSLQELPAAQYERWTRRILASDAQVHSAYIPSSETGLKTSLQLSELWLLTPDTPLSPWGSTATGKKAVYASAYQMQNMKGIEKYRKILEDNKLNAIVVDMKDDYGLLRFEPNSPLLKQKGKVTQYKIDLDTFVSEYKKSGIYLIGRIVVFKDRNLASYDKQQYAVWDKKNNMPWIGIKGVTTVTDEEGQVTGSKVNYYDENWVDPYSEEVWEYNVEIAKELIERGFDEIQFDYIRFPTDGTNMGDASFRWKSKGMDKESALISFLSYARKNIAAPIGIDIYGANGWYRSGTRTGQDVELMSHYVDVICPMYYPSHFEQDFLEYTPVIERPYRIYFYGSYRNTVIGRNRIIVRPWVQAFYMGVRFDRAYYNKDYVRREIFGVRDGLNRGYMYWNNSGGYYEDISPDVADDEVSPGAGDETQLQQRLPAFSGGSGSASGEAAAAAARERRKDMISILDSALDLEDMTETSAPQPVGLKLLHIEPFGTLQK